MPSKLRRTRLAIASAVTVAVVAIVAAILTRPGAPQPVAGPATATGTASRPPTTASALPATAPSATFQAARDTVTIDPPKGGTVVVHGTYPQAPSRCVHPQQAVLDRRYPGTMTIERAPDGTMTLVLTMPFERYLEGIAEVPSSWPPAALEAQAVAARSYALARTGWTGTPGETLRRPICSTDACQVYSGLPVDPAAATEPNPWRDAVHRTSGQVLLYAGRPADALYFSTSNGRTYGNDQVFGSPPLPYLRPVVERDDGASPEAHWRAALPLADLTRFLTASGDWPSGPGISNVRRHGATITVSGHGLTRTLDVTTFRSSLNTWAHCLEPETYPGPGSRGVPLPLTVPSNWFAVATRDGTAILAGRGWGHGVGMVQWGAHGKAERGLSFRQILAAYYGGLRPVRFAEPDVIRVIVASGLDALEITGSGSLTVDGLPAGTAELSVRGGDRLIVTAGPA